MSQNGRKSIALGGEGGDGNPKRFTVLDATVNEMDGDEAQAQAGAGAGAGLDGDANGAVTPRNNGTHLAVPAAAASPRGAGAKVHQSKRSK